MIQSIDLLKTKFECLININFMSFDEVSASKNKMRVYVIYGNDTIIYIGKTNKFHIRFGTDRRHESTQRLVKKIIDHRSFEDFYRTKCQIKFKFCESNREAEAIAIYILDLEFIYCNY